MNKFHLFFLQSFDIAEIEHIIYNVLEGYKMCKKAVGFVHLKKEFGLIRKKTELKN